MKFIVHIFPISLVFSLGISACTVAKLEARLEADPQCKPISNPKTGALMPCPGSDKAFYLAAGFAPVKTDLATASGLNPSNDVASKGVSSNSLGATPITNENRSKSTTVDCKSKIHQKTGGLLPCPLE